MFKKELQAAENSPNPTKDEIKLAKWMRKNVPIKKTKFANHIVEYFTGSKAIDAIMESEWAKPKKSDEEPFFRNRSDVTCFLNIMLKHKMYHRAKKIVVSEEELKAKQRNKKNKDVESVDKKKDETGDEGKEEIKKKKKKCEENKEQTENKQQVKKKIRLEMHYQQVFTDGLDAYVWIFNPTPFYYWIFGFLVVIGAIGICLFPLWPPSVRMGVQYLSIAGACFIAFIIALAILRLIIFCIVWILTFGKFHLWLFPNLTEDVGFFASFWPLYQYEFKTEGSGKSKSGKKKKAKESDDEDDSKSEDEDNSDDDKRQTDERSPNEKGDNGGDDGSDTESEPSSSQQSQVGKDFEMVEKEEAEEEEDDERKK